MIPKILHWAWIGPYKIPPIFEKCYASWKDLMPDYEIRCWNENEMPDLPRLKNWMENKNYANAIDMFYTWMLHKVGGVWVNIDVLALKRFDDLLDNPAFWGIQSDIQNGSFINTGIVASEKGNLVMSEMLDMFNTEPDEFPISPPLTTKCLYRHGARVSDKIQHLENATIYPREYFYPVAWAKDWGEPKFTENTYSEHLWAGSWKPERFIK